jgi:hypothetical protein
MRKTISIILIITTILSLSAGMFVYKPKSAQAIFGIGDISLDPVQLVKELVLDGLIKPIARHAVVRLHQEISRWAQGGFTDENKPFAMTSWKEEVKGALQVASGKFVQEHKLTPLCAPFKLSIGTALGLDYPTGPTGAIPYTQYAACTLGDIVDNVEDFYKNPSISVYGWDSWTALMQPQNNFLGSLLMALERKEEIEEEETTEQEKEIEAGQGVKNETICSDTDLDLCKSKCASIYSGGTDSTCKTKCDNDYGACVRALKPARQCLIEQAYCIANCPTIDPKAEQEKCLKKCEKSSTGVCLKEIPKKLGSEIKGAIDNVIGSDMNWLITANEITDMINLVFSGLFNKLTHGFEGLLTKAFSGSTSKVSKQQLDYSYYRDFKRTQTPQDITKLKTDILTNILNSIKNVSAMSYECDKDNQLEGDVFAEIAADIINEESQHLYTSMEGVDLKPDFEVLDGGPAVDNGIAVYGQDWNDIPFSKYPPKCAEIANKQCKNIATGLPYNLVIGNINGECEQGCLAQINNYRAVGDADNDAINKTVSDGKCSNFAIGNQCLQGAYLIDKTKTYCNECVKKYQESCGLKETPAETTQCLENYCGNYVGISSVIKTSQDFYNRCALNETKYACEVCLKEYFMPADYCGQIYDYVNRAFVKYPAQIKEDLWWGMFNKFDDCANNRTGGDPWWLAFVRKIFISDLAKILNPINAAMWQNLPPTYKAAIPVGLTCRILPDFKFPGGGTCKTLCDVTDDELKDLTDNEPQELDCLRGPKRLGVHPDWGSVWESEGFHPGGQYLSYLVRKKIKCCGGLMGHDKEAYQKCRGQISDATGEPSSLCTYAPGNEQNEPWCYCNEEERPLGSGRTGSTGTPPGDKAPLGGDCYSFGFDTNGAQLHIYSNNNPDGDTFYISQGSECRETDENYNNTDLNDDGTPDNTPTDAIAPSSAVWQAELTPGERGDWFITLSAGNYNAGVYHNSNDDITSGIHVCSQCNPSDPDYPNYGTEFNQCDNKVE